MGVSMVADKLSQLRDALLEARPSMDGIDAAVYLRFKAPAEAE